MQSNRAGENMFKKLILLLLFPVTIQAAQLEFDKLGCGTYKMLGKIVVEKDAKSPTGKKFFLVLYPSSPDGKKAKKQRKLELFNADRNGNDGVLSLYKDMIVSAEVTVHSYSQKQDKIGFNKVYDLASILDASNPELVMTLVRKHSCR